MDVKSTVVLQENKLNFSSAGYANGILTFERSSHYKKNCQADLFQLPGEKGAPCGFQEHLKMPILA